MQPVSGFTGGRGWVADWDVCAWSRFGSVSAWQEDETTPQLWLSGAPPFTGLPTPKSPTDHLWEARASSVTLVNGGAGQVRRTVTKTSTCARTYTFLVSLGLWKQWCSGIRSALSLSLPLSLSADYRPSASISVKWLTAWLIGNQLRAISCALHMYAVLCDLLSMAYLQC